MRKKVLAEKSIKQRIKPNSNLLSKERRYRATVAYDHLRFCAHNVELIMPSAADEYERETLERQMYDALSSIPPVQANRIVAHYIDGKSFHEIAEEEGVKKMTIFVSIRLGIQYLWRKC